VTAVSPHMGTQGWPFASVDQFPGADVDPLYNSDHVRDLYLKVEPNYSGRFGTCISCTMTMYVEIFCAYRFTVPVLWDKKNNTIVNNESSEIIRMFNTAFNDFIIPDKAALDYYPANLRAEIDGVNEWIYPNINSTLQFCLLSHLCRVTYIYACLCRRCLSSRICYHSVGV
jgi:putative glutathione S-transferase